MSSAVRRIAREQIDAAVDDVQRPCIDPAETVHQVRKRCKKMRGLLRLVRPVLGATYAEENARFRDAARRLSGLRDEAACLGAFDAVLATCPPHLDRRAFEPIRRRLAVEARPDTEECQEGDEVFAALLHELQAARRRSAEWALETDGFDAVAGGVSITYGRGRRALQAVRRRTDDERLHEWRKEVKYHWYHLRLLRDLWKPVMQPRREAAHRLAVLLGDDHDLALLRHRLVDQDDSPAIRSLSLFVDLLDARRAVLQAEALTLGERLYAETPRAFVARMRVYWKVWCDDA